MKFKFAGARAQVCKFCKFLVARTDRGLVRVGQVADLVEIPSPLEVGRGGYWDRKRIEIEGRVQLDRVGTASAPWQEFFIQLPDSGEGFWIAFAQGRWYWTREITPPPPLPPLSSLRPGTQLQLPVVGPVTIAEVGRRKVISAEGELPNVAPPGGVTGYADFSGPNGTFGTFDYGDGQTVSPTLFVGKSFDPAVFKLDSGMPLEAPQAKVEACTCPNCGGSLPLVSPGTTERIVCRYCGTISDVAKGGALSALGQAPKPPYEPFIPLGSEGNLRGKHVIIIGFVIRGTYVEGGHYTWREYLAYGGPSNGYIWLMEEDNRWQLVAPIPPGEVQITGGGAVLGGKNYRYKQSVEARVEYVVGEFYWKVEIGERVNATEYEGPGGIVSVERDANEVNTSFCYPMTSQEIGKAFNIAPPPSPSMFSSSSGSDSSDFSSSSSSGVSKLKIIGWIVFGLFLFFFLMADCGDGDGVFFIGTFGGGK